MSVSGKDVMSGVDRRDKAMKDKLMSQFCRYDGMSRPVTPEYAEGWERIFGKKDEPSDTVNDVTPRTVPVHMTILGDPCRTETVEVAVDTDAG